MKKYAEIENNLVKNISNHDDAAELPSGWIDVTSIPCSIGWPIESGVPLAKPSSWHTVNGDNTGWEVTAENQVLKDEYDAEQQRAADIYNEQESTGLKHLTVDQAKQIITDRIDIVRALPESNLTEIQAKIAELCDQTEWLLKRVAVFLLN